MRTVAAAIVCKTPEPGKSKTRLSPPLRPEDCAAISACFIQDLAATIANLVAEGGVTGYALYTPVGSEQRLLSLLPRHFQIHPQRGEGFGERLMYGAIDLLEQHDGVILINSDSPTLPLSILRDTVTALRAGDSVVLSPAEDGGYTLIGLSKMHARLFEDIPWSTPLVHRLTLERAAEIDLPVVNVDGWYDVDDEASLGMLRSEFSGAASFSTLKGEPALATRRFLNAHALAASSSNP